MDRYKDKALVLHRYGSRYTFFVFSFAVVLLLYWMKEFEDALIFLLTFTATMGAVVILKLAFRVPRPEGSDLENGSYAFPSGHATGIFFLVVTISHLAYTHLSSLWFSLILITLLAASVLVSLSRIILNVHTKIQVITGALIGFLIPLIILSNKESILSYILSIL